MVDYTYDAGNQVKIRLQQTAGNITRRGNSSEFGHGFVNTYEAIDR